MSCTFSWASEAMTHRFSSVNKSDSDWESQVANSYDNGNESPSYWLKGICNDSPGAPALPNGAAKRMKEII